MKFINKYWPSGVGLLFIGLLICITWKVPVIGWFLIIHWYGSLFFQTFFHHRYAAHGMFSMSKFWEKTFYILTYIFQGSSFLMPKAYALLHRSHHAFSDTKEDPHSPHHYPPIITLMNNTKIMYDGYKTDQTSQFNKNDFPQWNTIDTIGSNWYIRILWGIVYSMIYIFFVPPGMWYLYLLLPIHFLMSPIHGMIVNWWGHWYGYQNFDNGDKSTNVFIWDVIMLGECYQNNHHKYPSTLKFSVKPYEFDPVYWMIQPLKWLNIIHMNYKN